MVAKIKETVIFLTIRKKVTVEDLGETLDLLNHLEEETNQT